MDSYHPGRPTPPRDSYHNSDRSENDDDFQIRGAASAKEPDRPQERSNRFQEDFYDERPKYRSRSPRRYGGYAARSSDGYDSERSYGRHRERDTRHDISDAYDREVEYHRSHYDEYSRSEILRYERERDRGPPPAKRQYRGPPSDRYQEYEDLYMTQPAAPPAEPPYRGEYDVTTDGTPLKFLLVRGLKESVTEELFAKGLEKLYRSSDAVSSANTKAPGATEGSIHRVQLIRHRQTDDSMGYGYVWFHDLTDAKAALAKAIELGNKCTISSQPITVSFSHLTVFPRADYGKMEFSQKFTFVVPHTGARHKYHKPEYYATELIVNAEPPPSRSPPPSEDGKGARALKWDPYAAKPSTLEAMDTDNAKRRKKTAPGSIRPQYLQHWQNKAAELRGKDVEATAEPAVEKASRQPASGVNAISTTTTPADTQCSDEQTFCVDTEKQKCCYLCMSQFEASDILHRHVRESKKHAENVANEDAVKKGYHSLKVRGIKPDSTIKLLLASSAAKKVWQGTPAEPQGPMYRDRAAERRKEEAQSGGGSKPNVSFSLKGNKSSNKGGKPDAGSKDDPPAASASAGPPSYGKGTKLLQKAGWSEGQGLGSSTNEGRVAPIEQNVYATGVGLGHEGGNMGDAVEEAARATKSDRSGFLEKTKQVARQRFEKMG